MYQLNATLTAINVQLLTSIYTLVTIVCIEILIKLNEYYCVIKHFSVPAVSKHILIS